MTAKTYNDKKTADPPFDFAQGRLFGDDMTPRKAKAAATANAGFLHSAAHDRIYGFFAGS
jgi:hypothetical protein